MKITLQHNQKLFFTSDTHFHHKNICQGTTEWEWTEGRNYRPFQTLEEMDKTLIDNINSVIGEDDVLIHLGDWSFGGKEQIWEFRKQIKCKNIYLFLGNHDHHIQGNKVVPNAHWKIGVDPELVDGPNPKKYGDARDSMFDTTFHELFKEVRQYGYLTISVPQVRTSKMVTQPKNKKLRFVLSHFPIASWHDMKQGVKHLHGHIHTPHEHKVGPGKMMDVGVDGHPEFRPYELNEVLDLLENQPIKGLLNHDYDHHE
jgi:calcineurin-like phosphoesterase family protein